MKPLRRLIQLADAIIRIFVNKPLLFLLYSTLLLIVFNFSSARAAEDQPEIYQMEEISVTATRQERKTVEVPASIAVVGENDIKDTRMFNLKEALLGIPGLLIDTRNQGYDSRLIIRGAGLKARYGVRDIMVLLDGVPITDPDSLTRLDFIDTQLIQRIEVVKGPNSTLWGANAAGGVINIITKSSLDRQGGVFKIGTGNYNTQNYHLSYSDNLSENFYYTVSGSRRQSDSDWRRWNEFYTNQGAVQIAYVFEDESTLENHISYTKASLQLPGKLNQTQFDQYLKSGEADATDGPWQHTGRYSEIFFFSSKLSKTVDTFDFEPLLFINKWTHHHPVTGRINDSDTLSCGTDIQANLRHTFGKMKGTLTAGVTARFDKQDTDYFEYADVVESPGGRITASLSDTPGNLIEIQNRGVRLYGVYFQESIRPSERWIVDLGVRFDSINFDIDGTKWAEYDYSTGTYVECPDASLTNCGNYQIDKTFNGFSPRVGAVYKLSETINLYGNISKGIQTPTEGEISENPDLELVEVTNYEVGAKLRYYGCSLETALYYSPVKNEIVKVVQEDGETEYRNAGRTRKTGFELTGSLELTRRLTLGAAYSYTHYTFEEFTEIFRVGALTRNIDRSGNRLPYIPEHQYSFFAGYRHPSGLMFKLESHTWGPYYIDNANTEKYEGYAFITGVMIGYEWKAFDIRLNIDNLFDEYYAVEVEKDTSGVKRYTPAAPRSFILRFTYNF
jgi:iron complex outermembrane recepter protein